MHLNLLLLGMSGSGKTATLKSIVMRDNIQAQGGWETALGGYQQGEVTFGGHVINVVDTPGLFSTHMMSEENQMEVFQNFIRETFQRFPGGFHALVLVLSYGRRFGQDDRDTMKVLEDVFGKDWLQTHGVALITGGDKFKRDLKNESFYDRCRKMPGPMGDIFKECNFRCVLFDNVTEDKEVADNQQHRLVSVVEALGKTQECFTLRTIEKQQGSDAEEEIGILLMGITGHGKSATGNSILGRDEFVSQGGWGSLTKTYHAGYTRFGSRVIKVVDIPGFADSDETSEGDKVQLVITALTKALTKFPNGFHAVLLVVSYAIRLTKEVKETLRYFFEKFDKDAFKRNGVLVVTNGDVFDRDNKKPGGTETLRDWLKDNFKERLDACGGRCVLFDNVTEDESTKENQVLELLGQIDSMDNDGSLYIPEICKYKGDNEEAFDKDRKRIAENERAQSLLGLIKDDLYKAKNQPPHLRKKAMSQLARDVVSVRKRISLINCTLDTNILNMLERLEDDIENSKQPEGMAECVQTVTNTQNEIDKVNMRGELWDNMFKCVSEFVNTFNPVVGARIMQVGASIKAVGTFLSRFFG